MIKLKSIIKEEILSEQRPNQDTEKLSKILGRNMNDIHKFVTSMVLKKMIY